MQTTAYLQFLAKRQSRDGKVVNITVKSVSQNRPKAPLPGAFVLKLTLDIPVEVFMEQEIEISIPEQLLAPEATCLGVSGEQIPLERGEDVGDDN